MVSRAFNVFAAAAFFLISYSAPNNFYGAVAADSVTPGATWHRTINPEAFGCTAIHPVGSVSPLDHMDANKLLKGHLSA
ncbi:MAG: hypothetical protein MI741_15710 [Rhodospirillales bacterium]|nr:hypothetical protein [Rhodospirillales bacterium]